MDPRSGRVLARPCRPRFRTGRLEILASLRLPCAGIDVLEVWGTSRTRGTVLRLLRGSGGEPARARSQLRRSQCGAPSRRVSPDVLRRADLAPAASPPPDPPHRHRRGGHTGHRGDRVRFLRVPVPGDPGRVHQHLGTRQRVRLEHEPDRVLRVQLEHGGFRESGFPGAELQRHGVRHRVGHDESTGVEHALECLEEPLGVPQRHLGNEGESHG